MLFLLNLCGTQHAQIISKHAIAAGMSVDALQPDFAKTKSKNKILSKLLPDPILLLPSETDILLTVAANDFLLCSEKVNAQFKVLVADYRRFNMESSFRSYWIGQVKALQRSTHRFEIIRLEDFSTYTELLSVLIGKTIHIQGEKISFSQTNSSEHNEQLAFVGYEK